MPAPTKWQAFELEIPGKELLTATSDSLEAVLLYLDVAKAILDTIKTFLVSIGNPIQALATALVSLILATLESLRQSGIYWWALAPDFEADPNLKRLRGGYGNFAQRWKGSLLDAQDLNRPRPVPGFNSGGFMMFVVDAKGPERLIQLIEILSRFFGVTFTKPQYPPPANLKILPIGSNGDPILQIAQWFNADFKGLAIEWSLPTTTGTPDPSFQGLSSELGTEFAPPQWLVERTTVYPTDPVKVPAFDKVGQLVRDIETGRDASNQSIMETVPVLDTYGEPVTIMETAVVLNNETAGTFFQVYGLLGKYRYIDTTVELGKTYYYRVRGFSGGLSWDSTTKKIKFSASDIKQVPSKQNTYYLDYPAERADNPVVMGRPTSLVLGKLPIKGEFDVAENIRRTLLAAYSLGFAQPFKPERLMVRDNNTQQDVPATDAEGNPVYKPVFDGNGDPISPYTVDVLGKGSLSEVSGWISYIEPKPLTTFTSYQLTGQNLEWGEAAPWTMKRVRQQAGSLTGRYSGLALEAGQGFIDGFKKLMLGVPPFGPPDNAVLKKSPSRIANASTLSELVFGLTEASDGGLGGIQQTTTADSVKTFGQAYNDKNVRKNVLAAVNYIKTLGYQGIPPDWGRLAILDDMLPWASQLLYEMLAKMKALSDGFNDIISEIKQFVEMLIRKIDALEKFIEFLLMILNYIESLLVPGGVYFLLASGLTGDTSSWISALDSATGPAPSSGPDGYTGGFCFAWVLPDPAAIETAFKAIFTG